MVRTARAARVADVMMHPVVDVHPEDTLTQVAETMVAESIGAVVVRGSHPPASPGNRPLGLVSERDIVAAIAAGTIPSDTCAEGVMTAELAVVRPDERLLDAVSRMIDDEVRHVPVVRDGVVVGMLSARDALRVLASDAQV
jgi:signal-transduction protein with cAMP-binding, CBS, and nucleotidyltransferase domain